MTEIPIRIRLKSGDAEIEVAGSREDVDSLLERWWSRMPRGEGSAMDKPSPRHAAERAELPETPGQPAQHAELAGKIKEHPQYAVLKAKCFLKNDRFRKVAAVAWATQEQLSSGDITKILADLGVKIDQPGVSNAIKANLGSFLHSESRSGGKAKYKLTTHAEQEFSEWLTAMS